MGNIHWSGDSVYQCLTVYGVAPRPIPLTSSIVAFLISVPGGNVISTFLIAPPEAVLNIMSYATLVFTILFDCKAETLEDIANGTNIEDLDSVSAGLGVIAGISSVDLLPLLLLFCAVTKLEFGITKRVNVPAVFFFQRIFTIASKIDRLFLRVLEYLHNNIERLEEQISTDKESERIKHIWILYVGDFDPSGLKLKGCYECE